MNSLGSVQVRNEKARRFLLNMRKKPGVNFTTYFPRADPGAVALLRRMLSFDPADRPTSEVRKSPTALVVAVSASPWLLLCILVAELATHTYECTAAFVCLLNWALTVVGICGNNAYIYAQAALADPYFAGLSQPAREPSAQPVSKLAFEFERRKLQVDEVRSLAWCTAVTWRMRAASSKIRLDAGFGDSQAAYMLVRAAYNHFRSVL